MKKPTPDVSIILSSEFTPSEGGLQLIFNMRLRKEYLLCFLKYEISFKQTKNFCLSHFVVTVN